MRKTSKIIMLIMAMIGLIYLNSFILMIPRARASKSFLCYGDSVSVSLSAKKGDYIEYKFWTDDSEGFYSGYAVNVEIDDGWSYYVPYSGYESGFNRRWLVPSTGNWEITFKNVDSNHICGSITYYVSIDESSSSENPEEPNSQETDAKDPEPTINGYALFLILTITITVYFILKKLTKISSIKECYRKNLIK